MTFIRLPLSLYPAQYDAIMSLEFEFPKAQNRANLILAIIDGEVPPLICGELRGKRSQTVTISIEVGAYSRLKELARNNSCTVSALIRWRALGEPLARLLDPESVGLSDLAVSVHPEQYAAFEALKESHPSLSSSSLLFSILEGSLPLLDCEVSCHERSMLLTVAMSKKRYSELVRMARSAVDGGLLSDFIRRNVFADDRNRRCEKVLAPFLTTMTRPRKNGSNRSYIPWLVMDYENDAITETLKSYGDRFKSKGDLLLALLAGEDISVVHPVPHENPKRMNTRVYLDVADIDAIKAQMLAAKQNPTTFLRAAYFGADYQPVRVLGKQRAA